MTRIKDLILGGKNKMAEFKDLEGKTIVEIFGAFKNSEEIKIKCECGTEYIMYHSQDCCECVIVEDICGDIEDLLNTPILKADEIIHKNENPEEVKTPEWERSFTWTFYNISTIKGSVSIRWHGNSNGYYSESVDFKKIK